MKKSNLIKSNTIEFSINKVLLAFKVIDFTFIENGISCNFYTQNIEYSKIFKDAKEMSREFEMSIEFISDKENLKQDYKKCIIEDFFWHTSTSFSSYYFQTNKKYEYFTMRFLFIKDKCFKRLFKPINI